MDCKKCARDLFSPSKTAVCAICKAAFHPACTRIKNIENYKKMSKDTRERWKCDTCKDSGGSQSENTDQSRPEMQPSELSVSDPVMTDKTGRAILEVNQKLDKLMAMAGDLKDLKVSVNFMSDQFDVYTEKMVKLEATLEEVLKENMDLKFVVTGLQQKVDVLEQSSRNVNVELHCIPESRNEDCVEIVKTVSRVLNAGSVDVSAAFRVGPIRNDRPRKILAVLKSSEARENLIKSAKSGQGLTANQLFQNWSCDRVFVNENLTPFRADLLRRAKTKAKERGYRYVWLKNFVVHVRKDDGERVRTIKSYEDVDRM